MAALEKGSFSSSERNTPDEHKSWWEWQDINCSSYVYVKNLYNALEHWDGFAAVGNIAEATGGVFTEQSILDICQKSEWPIQKKEVDGKFYVEIEPFLDKFIGELKWETYTPSYFPEYEKQMQEVAAQMGLLK